ncbi:unnamed protein product, partial [Tilletia controversa]
LADEIDSILSRHDLKLEFQFLDAELVEIFLWSFSSDLRRSGDAIVVIGFVDVADGVRER